MAVIIATEARTEKLDLRLTPTAKSVLQTAASVRKQSMSEFVLESALSQAAETLPDRRHFGLNAERWTAFQAALDAPPQPLPRLGVLLRGPGPFEPRR